jgi:hypothetical protein
MGWFTMTKSFKGVASLCLVIAVLAAVAAGAGIFLRGGGATASATSIRGEQYLYVTEGIYAFNPVRVVAEGVGWDYVTLFVAVPVLLLSLPGVARGSLRARLLATGILGYFFYQYLMYAQFWAFGPLLPLFIALYALSAVAIVWTVSTVDIAELPSRVGDSFPRKGMAVFCSAMALMLTAMWAQRLATAYRGDLSGAGLLGQPTFTVQVMDLGMLVPLAVATAVLLWRENPWGYLLGVVFAVKGATMAGAICAMLISAAVVEGQLEVVPFAIFGAAALVSAGLAWRMLANVAEDEGRLPVRAVAEAG